MKAILSFFLILQFNLGFAQSFGTDQPIFSAGDFDESHVRVLAASNGDLYAAVFRTPITPIPGVGGDLYFLRSTDGGAYWSAFAANNYTANLSLLQLDMTIIENSPTDGKIYFVTSNYNTNTNEYFIGLTSLNLVTNMFVTNNLPPIIHTDGISDIAIANDSDFPGDGSSPSSVNITYVRNGLAADSIISYVSQDGGINFPIRNIVHSTARYVRNIALDYGQSPSGSNGRFICAWDSYTFSADLIGQVHAAVQDFGPAGTWQAADRLDDLNPTTSNRSRNPKIAVQRSVTDNSFGSFTAMVVFETDPDGLNADLDIYAASNSSAHSAHTWNVSNVFVGPNYGAQPDLVYDRTNQRFAASYVNYTTGQVLVKTITQNTSGSSMWSPLSNPVVNDNVGLILNASPRITYVAATNRLGVCWINDNPTKRVAMYDSYQNGAGLGELSSDLTLKIYPNPATDIVTIELEEVTSGSIVIADLNGKNVFSSDFSGEDILSLNMNSFNSGAYLIQIVSDDKTQRGTFIKQ